MPARDITTEERYRTTLRIGHVLNSSLDIDVVLGRVAAELKSVFPLEHVALLLVNPDGETYTWTNITSGGEVVALPGKDIPLRGGTLGWFMEHRGGKSYVLYRDLDRERPFAEDEIVLRRGLRSGIRVPLVINDMMFGQLAVASSKPDSFTEEMGEFLVEVAPHVATAVANARAYAQLNARKEDLLNEALLLRDELNALHRFGELVGASRAVEDLKDTIRRVAPTEATALILGETGTGKELVARALHDLSPRRERALVKVNCAALQDTLLLSELFGHEKGAFTGAVQRKAGRFELAHRGTIFLDEIGEISTEAQVKILRVMQEREFERVGGTQTIQVDTRIIAATNRNLEKEVREGRFRNDLFFRLNVIPIRVPSLRERKEDISTFVDYFVEKHGPRLNRRVKRVDPKALARLMRYDWPGNIRELENVVERGLVLGKGETLTFQKQLLGDAPPPPRSSEEPEEFETLEVFERRHILSVLERTGGVVSGVQGAAQILGMKPTTLTSRMKKLGIRPSRLFNVLKN